MPNAQSIPTTESCWKGLYQLGGWSAVASGVILILGIVTFFIWPYAPGWLSMQELFDFLYSDPLGGLLKLDLLLLLENIFGIFLFLVLYIPLRSVSESTALVALVLGLIAVTLIFPAHPITELFHLSSLYIQAAGEPVRSQYPAAGEGLIATFYDTAWMVNTFVGGFSLLLSSVLMLRSPLFSKAAAREGNVNYAAVRLFFLPWAIGRLLLFLILPIFAFGILAPVFMIAAIFGLGTTIVSTIWYVLLARDFFRMAK